MPEAQIAGGQMILGLVVGITLLIFLILKTKIHAFLALIISAATTGLIGGMPPNDVIDSITLQDMLEDYNDINNDNEYMYFI